MSEAYEHGQKEEQETIDVLSARGESLAAYKAQAREEWTQMIAWWQAQIPTYTTHVEERTETANLNIEYFNGRIAQLDTLES